MAFSTQKTVGNIRCVPHRQLFFIECAAIRAAEIPEIKKSPRTIVQGDLAADEGFEPSRTESESGVLPLH